MHSIYPNSGGSFEGSVTFTYPKISVFLSVGVNLSTKINNIFTTLNLCIVVLVTLLGFSKADKENWGIQGGDSLNYNITTVDGSSGTVGYGGFFPFGVSGTLAGAGMVTNSIVFS